MQPLEFKNSFGLVAKEYQKYRRSYDPQLYELLFSLLPQEDLKILDIGCGTGKSTEPLVGFNGRNVSVVGIDPDEAMLAEAKSSAKEKNVAIEYVRGAAENLPFEKGSFDAAISGAAFHWFGNEEALKGIRSVLKESGVLFVFWTQYVKDNKPTIGSEVFKKYKWQGIPKQFREQQFVMDLLTSSGFSTVTKRTFTFTERRTIEEIMGNFRTNSSYALMSKETRVRFMEEMRCAYETALGKGNYEENTLEFRVVYGFN